MIHIVTVHWRDDRWIDIQLNRLAAHIEDEYRVYAFLNEIPSEHYGKFYYYSTESIGSHAVKLNLLADMAYFNAERKDDWLLFLDGDAFPIDDVVEYGKDKLERYALAAVQREENHGDVQPHPCFCLTTVGFWKSIRGDWKKGFKWRNRENELVTDVGGNLLETLEAKGVGWYAMKRRNEFELHPVFFGIYDGVVYHHGSGFRQGMSRVYVQQKKRELEEAGRWRSVGTWLRKVSYAGKAYDRFLEKKAKDLARRESKRLNEYVFASIARDPDFYKMFQQ